MEEIDVVNRTAAELLEMLRNINPQRAGDNFIRLKEALEGHGYVIDVSKFGWATATLSESAQKQTVRASIRWSAARSPIAWFAPSWNDYRFVGTGTITIDVATIQISGRRVGWILGLPIQRTIELDRERIRNVETEGPTVRFEYREAPGRTRGVTLRCEDAAVAERIRNLLPGETTSDFRRRLPEEVAFDARMRSRTPNAYVTIALVLLNMSVFVVTATKGAPLFASNGDIEIQWGSNFGPFTTDGDWWRLLTSTFIHFGILHLFFNMWFLAATGPLVERLFGSTTFLFLYLVSGVVSSLAGLTWHPAANSAGASGAIFGLYGALLAALILHDSSIPVSVAAPLKRSAIVLTLYSMAAGLLVPGVDVAGHIGGLFGGFILGAVFARRLAISDEPARRIPILLRGAALGAVLICIGTFLALDSASLMQGSGLFWRTQHWFKRNEDFAVARWLSISAQVRKDKLDDAHFADLVARQVLPVWQEAEHRFQAVKLNNTSPEFPKLQFLREFTTSRRTGYEMIVKAARAHDSALSERGSAELLRGNQMVKKRETSTAEGKADTTP